MKKHELLKYAYDNFPKGTLFTWSDGITIIVSNGKFKINDDPDELLNVTVEKHIDKIDYIIFDGIRWAEIIKQKSSKFIMKSEDGLDLHKGDDAYSVRRKDLKIISNGDSMICSACVNKKDDYAFFKSKESAEKWIYEQNKPKDIIFDYPTITIRVDKDGFSATSKIDTRRFVFESEDIKKISKAHDSLQQQNKSPCKLMQGLFNLSNYSISSVKRF